MSAIGTERTGQSRDPMSAFGGEADMGRTSPQCPLMPKADEAALLDCDQYFAMTGLAQLNL
jgi:hypothetical protein